MTLPGRSAATCSRYFTVTEAFTIGSDVATRLHTRAYDRGVKISDGTMAQPQVTTHATHPQWNYTIRPRR